MITKGYAMPKVIMKCQNCDGDYLGMSQGYRITKFCSHKCAGSLFIKEKTFRNCKTCKLEFNDFVNRKRKRIFCSIRCVRFGGNPEDLKKFKGFWKTATEEQKRERLAKEYNDRVIKQDGCWDWKTPLMRNGYTKIQTGRMKIIGGHRVSWIIHKGEIPEGLFVLHKCDNPKCTNPDHLFLGTHTDNVRDMIKKGRSKFNWRKTKD
jgi:hypothetical protein